MRIASDIGRAMLSAALEALGETPRIRDVI